MTSLREDAFTIVKESINAVMPDEAVARALQIHKDKIENTKGKIILVAIGKAAPNMALKTKEILTDKIDCGLVVTKYGHLKEGLEVFECIEAGHPILDDNSIKAGERAVEMVSDLSSEDLVLFLVSGGGSAVFEKPLDGVSLQDITIVTDQLLASGASIDEINTVRKHLSDVKGGRFAGHCKNANILVVALSDVIGNAFNTIASGPVHPDPSTSQMALSIIGKYNIFAGQHVLNALSIETPKSVDNVTSYMAGSVKDLCEVAANTARRIGYTPLILTTSLNCEAKEAGRMMASIAKDVYDKNDNPFYPKPPCAIILGGETVVTVKGKGLGGRSQELVLSAAIEIEGLSGLSIFSVGSDGTDGPTDAAGGIVDGESVRIMKEEGIDPYASLENNDSYRALLASGDLIMTGPTGTNVNDLMVILSK